MFSYAASDIDLQFATRAYYGISFSPEKRGQDHVVEYLRHMGAVKQEFEAYATDENRAEVAKALADYKAGYLKRLNAMLAAKSNCVSSVIVGGSNFPVRKAQKANDAAHKRAGDFYDYCDWKLERMRLQFDPRRLEGGPIRLDDADVISQLQEKIATLRTRQENMKAANKIMRAGGLTDDQRIERLMSETNYTEETAREILQDGGFPRWALTNNLSNVKRLEARLAQAIREAERDQPDNYPVVAGVQAIENKDITRMQLVFEEKPDRPIRTLLKANGFIWAPSQGAWQRLLNYNGRAAAKRVLRQIQLTV